MIPGRSANRGNRFPENHRLRPRRSPPSRTVSGAPHNRGMRKFGWVGFVLVVSSGVAAVGAAWAGDTSSSRDKELIDCPAPGAPYTKYGCPHAYLGDAFLDRLIN